MAHAACGMGHGTGPSNNITATRGCAGDGYAPRPRHASRPLKRSEVWGGSIGRSAIGGAYADCRRLTASCAASAAPGMRAACCANATKAERLVASPWNASSVRE